MEDGDELVEEWIRIYNKLKEKRLGLGRRSLASATNTIFKELKRMRGRKNESR